MKLEADSISPETSMTYCILFNDSRVEGASPTVETMLSRFLRCRLARFKVQQVVHPEPSPSCLAKLLFVDCALGSWQHCYVDPLVVCCVDILPSQSGLPSVHAPSTLKS